ncbi:hypothetical protein JMJ77_0012831 [Colletotrichum scovillei]|uniref:Secreted protein n=1 Tax=Colletotrichum scovillei TaxID=1209932 RepID=A0A9P7R640_9PEZI|nr:hypothetical protein JMJ77_0012831 [Colletotrichum scovillei]KAG7069114.1 hypothetical protein JMJ76_0002790 [Colletotrichum scovillei]KAG7073066.1 hypothetical protein JMJ78_0014047 [Colletotrichum scovillei]
MLPYIILALGSLILRPPTGGHVTGKSQENGKGHVWSSLHCSSHGSVHRARIAQHRSTAQSVLSTRLEPATANLTGLHRQPSNEPPRISPRNPFRSRARRRHTSDICALIHRAIVPTAIDPLRLCRLSSSSMSHN